MEEHQNILEVKECGNVSWIELAQNNSINFSFYIWNLLRSFRFGLLREYLCHL